MKKQEKKGISPVVATILLVLITFMAIGIIWAFIKPMVEDSLEEGGSCFKLRDNAEVVDSEFTCNSLSNTKLMIRRSFEEVEINGFIVSITFGASSETYKLENGTETAGVKMFNENLKIKIPQPGGSETYVFEKQEGTRADLAVITTTGKICSMGSYKIPEC